MVQLSNKLNQEPEKPQQLNSTYADVKQSGIWSMDAETKFPIHTKFLKIIRTIRS